MKNTGGYFKATIIFATAMMLFCGTALAQEVAADLKPGADAQGELMRGENARMGKLAQEWLEASAALAKREHLVVLAQVWEGDKMAPSASFRYDRLPGVERVLEGSDAQGAGGGWYARREGKGWVQSSDWGKTGAPVDEKTAADLDAMAELGRREFEPLAPDPDEGAVEWRPARGMGGVTFERGREKWRPGSQMSELIFDAFMDKGTDGYPLFMFTHEAGEADRAMLLSDVATSWSWHGTKVYVWLKYFYEPGSEPPQGDEPGDRVLAAERATAAKPLRVDAVISGNERVRVAGIVSGKDFDLTMSADGKSAREIAVGDDAWLSMDGGATWNKQAKADRAPYDLARTPLGGRDIFEDVRGGLYDVADVKGEDGAALRRFTRRGGVTKYDIVFSDGKPAGLRTYVMREAGIGFASILGKTRLGSLWVRYEDAGTQAVVPPPGNAAAVPQPDADDLLADAMKAMSAGTWRVLERSARQWQAGEGMEGGEWRGGELQQEACGLVSGKDFDIAEGNLVAGTNRVISVGGHVWVNYGGGPWRRDISREKAGDGSGATISGFKPLQEWVQVERIHFESAGKETHDGETWLHIRPISGSGWQDSPQYWLLLGNGGKAVSVRRFGAVTWMGAGERMRAERIYAETDFMPAKAGEKIVSPADALRQALAQAETDARNAEDALPGRKAQLDAAMLSVVEWNKQAASDPGAADGAARAADALDKVRSGMDEAAAKAERARENVRRAKEAVDALESGGNGDATAKEGGE